MSPASFIPDGFPDLDRCRRIGKIFAVAAGAYWRDERLAGRPFVSRRPKILAPASAADLVSDPIEKQIICFLEQRISASPRDLQTALGCSHSTITRKVSRLRAVGLIAVHGRTRGASYVIRGEDGLN